MPRECTEWLGAGYCTDARSAVYDYCLFEDVTRERCAALAATTPLAVGWEYLETTHADGAQTHHNPADPQCFVLIDNVAAGVDLALAICSVHFTHTSFNSNNHNNAPIVPVSAFVAADADNTGVGFPQGTWTDQGGDQFDCYACADIDLEDEMAEDFFQIDDIGDCSLFVGFGYCLDDDSLVYDYCVNGADTPLSRPDCQALAVRYQRDATTGRSLVRGWEFTTDTENIDRCLLLLNDVVSETDMEAYCAQLDPVLTTGDATYPAHGFPSRTLRAARYSLSNVECYSCAALPELGGMASNGIPNNNNNDTPDDFVADAIVSSSASNNAMTAKDCWKPLGRGYCLDSRDNSYDYCVNDDTTMSRTDCLQLAQSVPQVIAWEYMDDLSDFARCFLLLDNLPPETDMDTYCPTKMIMATTSRTTTTTTILTSGDADNTGSGFPVGLLSDQFGGTSAECYTCDPDFVPL